MSTSKIRVATTVAFEILSVFPEPAVEFAVTASFVAATTANHRSHFCCGSSCVSNILSRRCGHWCDRGASRPFHSLRWVSLIPFI